MALYPILLNITGRLAVVIGGGDVALRKVRDLVEAGARVRIVSPEVHAEINTIAAGNPGLVEIVRREYRHGDLDKAVLAFSAAGAAAVNREVFSEAEERGIFINAADDPPNCSFFLPSFVRRGDLILAVSTGGASPAMAAKLRRMLEQYISDDIEAVLDALRESRIVLQTGPEFARLSFSDRGAVMKKLVNDDELLARLVRAYHDNILADFLSGLL